MRPGAITIILIAGGALRLIYFLLIWSRHPESFWITDSGEYWRLAENMIQHGEFSKSNGAPFEAEHLRTPLYPSFLALVQLGGGGLYSVIILQNVFNLATAWIASRITFSLSRNIHAAAITAAILAFDLPGIVFSDYVLSETLFVMLLAGSIHQGIAYFQNKKTANLILCSLLLGLSALTRPASLFLLEAWPVFLLAGSGSFLTKIKNLLVFVFVSLLTLAPWFSRNYITFDKIFFSTTGSFMLAAWHAPNVKAIKENKPVATARYELWTDWYYNSPYDAYQEPLKYMDYIREKSIDIISQEPVIALKQHFTGVFHLLAKPARAQFLHQLKGDTRYQPATVQNEKQLDSSVTKAITKSPWWLIALVIFQVLALVFVYAGCSITLFNFFRHPVWIQAFLFITILFLVNLVVPPITYSRFRLPVMPLLAIISALGWIRVRIRRPSSG